MDWFLIFLAVVITLLSLVLIVAGIQFILVMRSFNKALSKLHLTLDIVSHLTFNLSNPTGDLKSLGQGVKTGLQVAEHVFVWLKERKSKNNELST